MKNTDLGVADSNPRLIILRNPGPNPQFGYNSIAIEFTNILVF